MSSTKILLAILYGLLLTAAIQASDHREDVFQDPSSPEQLLHHSQYPGKYTYESLDVESESVFDDAFWAALWDALLAELKVFSKSEQAALDGDIQEDEIDEAYELLDELIDDAFWEVFWDRFWFEFEEALAEQEADNSSVAQEVEKDGDLKTDISQEQDKADDAFWLIFWDGFWPAFWHEFSSLFDEFADVDFDANADMREEIDDANELIGSGEPSKELAVAFWDEFWGDFWAEFLDVVGPDAQANIDDGFKEDLWEGSDVRLEGALWNDDKDDSDERFQETDQYQRNEGYEEKDQQEEMLLDRLWSGGWTDLWDLKEEWFEGDLKEEWFEGDLKEEWFDGELEEALEAALEALEAVEAVEAVEVARLDDRREDTTTGVINSAVGTQKTLDSPALFAASPCSDCALISGHAYHWRSHTLLESVEVAVTGGTTGASDEFADQTTTNAMGEFAFARRYEGSQQVSASKALAGADSGNVISSADALAALKLAVGINPNADPDGSGPAAPLPVSPYQLIAADITGDKKVTSADALAILKMAVQLNTAEPRRWLFVAENYDFWNDEANAGAGAFTTTNDGINWDPSGVLVDDPQTSVVNLVGVLLGDVNGDWNAAGSSKLDSTYFSRLQAAQGGSVAQWGLVAELNLNLDFETPDGAGWKAEGNTGTPPNGSSFPSTGGNPGGYWSLDAATYDTAWALIVSAAGDVMELGDLGLQAGKVFTVSQDSKILATRDDYPAKVGGMKVEFYKPNADGTGHDMISDTGDMRPEVFGDGTAWATYSFEYTIPADTTHIKYVPLWGNDNHVGIDNIVIGTVGTEPPLPTFMRVDLADGLTEVKADGTTGTTELDNWNNVIGEWYGGATGYIGFFQLPDLGMVSNPFVTSELGIRAEMSGNPSWNADVSMVRVSDNTVINHATDYDAEAVLIQSSFLSTDVVTALGELGGGDRNLFTSAAANVTLTSELNKAYDGGAGIGRYLVMRIAKSDTLPPSDSYKIWTRNAGGDGEHPLINFSLSGSELPGESIRTALESIQSTSATGGTVAGRPVIDGGTDGGTDGVTDGDNAIAAEDLVGYWTYAAGEMPLGLGPEEGDFSWFVLTAQGEVERACLMNDVFRFDSDGSFANLLGSQTWLEPWQGAAEGCDTPVSPHDGSATATYEYADAAPYPLLTIEGAGAYIGLPKVTNNGELSAPSEAPAQIIYEIAASTATTMTLQVNHFDTAHWTFKLVKTDAPSGSGPDGTDDIDNTDGTDGTDGDRRSMVSMASDGMIEARGTAVGNTPGAATGSANEAPGSLLSLHGDNLSGNDVWKLNIGEWYGGSDGNFGMTVGMTVFQLPNFGAVDNPFVSAEFEATLDQKSNNLDFPADLWAVRSADMDLLQLSDWFVGPSSSAPTEAGTLIQSNYLTPASPLGAVTTSADANRVLLDYLNARYDGGSGAGDYVIFRVNRADADAFLYDWNAYVLKSSQAQEGAAVAPTIHYISAVKPMPLAQVPATLGENLLINGGFDGDAGWTAISMYDELSEGNGLVTIANGEATFSETVTGEYSKHMALYTMVDLQPGTYQFDMDMTFSDIQGVFGEVYIGVDPPFDGSEFNGDQRVMVAFHMSTCPDLVTYSGRATEAECEAIASPGRFQITAAGTYYLLFRSGFDTYGPNGIILDNMSVREYQ